MLALRIVLIYLRWACVCYSGRICWCTIYAHASVPLCIVHFGYVFLRSFVRCRVRCERKVITTSQEHARKCSVWLVALSVVIIVVCVPWIYVNTNERWRVGVPEVCLLRVVKTWAENRKNVHKTQNGGSRYAWCSSMNYVRWNCVHFSYGNPCIATEKIAMLWSEIAMMIFHVIIKILVGRVIGSMTRRTWPELLDLWTIGSMDSHLLHE